MEIALGRKQCPVVAYSALAYVYHNSPLTITDINFADCYQVFGAKIWFLVRISTGIADVPGLKSASFEVVGFRLSTRVSVVEILSNT